MITSVLRYKKDLQFKSKYVLHSQSAEYNPLMVMSSKGEVPLYIRDADNIRSTTGRRPAYALSSAKGHVSGVFTPDLKLPDMGYGNFGDDALLIQKTGDEIIIIIILGAKFHDMEYWFLWTDGDPEFTEELEGHFQKVKFTDSLINKG